MSKLAILGTVEVAPDQRNHVLSLLVAHRARCLRDEPGTLQFEIMLPREDESRIRLYELYQDDDAFEVHRSGTSIAQWREETAGMVVTVHVTHCDLAEKQGPSGPDIQA